MDIQAIINMYNTEHSRRDAIVQSLSLPAGFLLGAVAAYSAMVLSFNWSNFFYCEYIGYSNFIRILFIITSFLFFVTLIRSFLSLKTAASGQTYKYIGNIQDWLDFKKELSKFYQDTYPENWEVWTDTRFNEHLVRKYTECTDENFLQNNEKSSRRHELYNRILTTMVFLVVCIIPFYLNYIENPPVQKIFLTN